MLLLARQVTKRAKTKLRFNIFSCRQRLLIQGQKRHVYLKAQEPRIFKGQKRHAQFKDNEVAVCFTALSYQKYFKKDSLLLLFL